MQVLDTIIEELTPENLPILRKEEARLRSNIAAKIGAPTEIPIFLEILRKKLHSEEYLEDEEYFRWSNLFSIIED
jgi:hypothetical protein